MTGGLLPGPPECFSAMEPAGHVVWRARTCCKRALLRSVSGSQAARLSSAYPRLCVSTATSPISRRLPTATSLCSAPRASMSLCNSAVPPPGSAFLCTGAGRPLRNLCASAASAVCWSCQSVVGSSELFCPSCSSIQPPNESKDFFQLLDCERSFNIDVQDLQRKYRNLQRLLHPDYFSQKSQGERDISEKQSSLVNKAYNTLLSPLSRGKYLLSLHGITITEGGVDSAFLFEILEINEKLDMSTEAEMEEIGTFIQDTCQSLTENVRGAFEKGDLESAKMLLTKMKYYSNILDQVKKKMIP